MIPKGTRISDRYLVEKLIGAGGMQDVYLARDNFVERQIALKSPQPGQKQRRFRDSAIIAARVNHHNVAKTLDYLEMSEGQFLAEEYVHGMTLEVFVDGKYAHVDPDLGLCIFSRLAGGIAASHQVGVIHRDLKPSNVLLQGSLFPEQIKITDFGIASLTNEVFEEARNSTDITRSSSKTIQGALPYMAPEMMFRKAGDFPGTPADVWSLGAMMFKIVTGSVPFGEGFEVPVAIRTGARVPWPAFMTSKPQFAPLSRDLMHLIDACLQLEPSARPTASDVLNQTRALCSQATPRMSGEVIDLRYGGAMGFIRAEDGAKLFFHSDSFYGVGKPMEGMKVTVSCYPGAPYPRAHPVVPLL